MSEDKTDLAFLPLGGTGEIGMNLNLYRLDGKYLAVDCGIGFGGAELPEVEIMVPDPSFIAERRGDLVGLVITHAHEDHIGAVAWLWEKLRCQIICTPFAAAVLKRKLGEHGLVNQVKINIVPSGASFRIGSFDLRFLAMTHSVPESQALVIKTKHGNILHTGDWKLDPGPMVGPVSDEASLRALGEEGVLAMVCDSTNALVDGHSGSEGDVRRELATLIKTIPGRIAVTCFASNVARVESITLAALAAGRSAALVGRSLRNMDQAARECGYFKGLPAFLSEAAAEDMADNKILMIVTGSQGEPRSALARIAADTHPSVALGEGDTVVFSSRVIPGNERAIHAVQDNLVRRGVNLISADQYPVHCSGHPARDELRKLYDMVKPKYAVPVHGEWRHLQAHADLARECGAQPLLLEDGDILRLAPGVVEVVDSAPVGRLVVDGGRLLPLTGGVMSARRRLLFNGVVVASIAVDQAGQVRGVPKISAPGLFENDDAEADRVARDFLNGVEQISPAIVRDDALFAEAARAVLRRALGKKLQKRPMVELHLIRV
jgi:ribonuclease J